MLFEFLGRYLFRKKPRYSMTQGLLVDLAAILIWRGMWGLMDLYLFPGHKELSFFISIGVGLALMIALKFILKML